MKIETISSASIATIGILVIALIIFGAPFFLISFWTSFEPTTAYKIISIIENNNTVECDESMVTLIKRPDSDVVIAKCGELGVVNQLIYLPAAPEKSE